MEISVFTVDTEAVSLPSSVARVSSSSAITVLFKTTGVGITKVGWFNISLDVLVTAAVQGMNCKEVAEDRGTEMLIRSGQ